MGIYRRSKLSRNGWNSGDIDVAFQLFRCGMVWDGNLTSKASRDWLVEQNFAVRHDGMQSLTGRGVLRFMSHHRTWISAFRRWRRWKRSPFVADGDSIRRAMN